MLALARVLSSKWGPSNWPRSLIIRWTDEHVHLGTLRVAEMVPYLNLPALGPTRRRAYENQEIPRARDTRFRPAWAQVWGSGPGPAGDG